MSNEDNSITVNIKDDQVAVYLTKSESPNEEFEKLPVTDNDLDIEVLNLFKRLIEKNLIKSNADFKVIGRLLHRALFTKLGARYLKAEYERNKPTSEKRLRIELKFEGRDTCELFNLPWEYLCDKTSDIDWEFVSTGTKVVLTRNYPLNLNTTQLVALNPNKINVLVVVLNPDPDKPPAGLGDLSDVENGVKEQLEEFKKSLQKKDFEVVVKYIDNIVTWKHFDTQIKAFIKDPDSQPHILHLIAHGQFLDDQNIPIGQIAFHRYDPEEYTGGVCGKNIKWISDTDIVDLFINAGKLPRFVFLHTCEGGAIAKRDGSAGVALCLAQEGVPAVVAMQHPIEKHTSLTFSRVLYESLGLGWTIDKAVQIGRAAIKEDNTNNHAFGTPVVYFSTRNEPILPTLTSPPPEGSKSLQLPPEVAKHFALLPPEVAKSLKSLLSETSDPQKTIDFPLYVNRIRPLIKQCQDEKKLKSQDLNLLIELAKTLWGKGCQEWITQLTEYAGKLDHLNKKGNKKDEAIITLCADLITEVKTIKGQL